MYEYMYVTYSRLNRNTKGQIKCDIIATRMIKPLKVIQRSQKGVPKLSVIECLSTSIFQPNRRQSKNQCLGSTKFGFLDSIQKNMRKNINQNLQPKNF